MSDLKNGVFLVPNDERFVNYTAYVKFLGIDHMMWISNMKLKESSTPESRRMRHWADCPLDTSADTRVKLSDAFRDVLQSGGEHVPILRRLVVQSISINDCAKELGSYFRKIERNTEKYKHLPPVSFYHRLIAELEAVGWDNVLNMSEDLMQVDMRLQDAKGRVHTVFLNMQESATGKGKDAECLYATLELDVPMEEKSGATARKKLPGGGKPIHELMKLGAEEFAKHQTFWDVMDDFDANVWVLEPQNPTRSSCVRRIAVEEHCSMHIKISPTNPQSMCECDFMGQDKLVEPLRTRLHSRLNLWDPQLMPRKNLETILEVSFPHPESSSKEDFNIECGICYSFKRGKRQKTSAKADEAAPALLPDFICNTCGQAFHHPCISEWLQSVPSTRRSFNMLFGACPYCSSSISAPAQNN
jgi:E3 ubiquitin-protein ligase FANCL